MSRTLTVTALWLLAASCSSGKDQTTDSAAAVALVPPTLTLTAPESGALYNEGEQIYFSAAVTDEDGETPPWVEISWTSDIDGLFSTRQSDSAGLADFITAALTPGEHTITVEATDDDAQTSRKVLVLTVNGTPTEPAVSLSPTSPATGDALSVVLDTESEDADGDAVAYRYEWYVDGALSTASSGPTLPAVSTARGDSWRVVVTPYDDWTDGPSADASVIIGNTAPSYDSAVICEYNADTTETCPATEVAAGDLLSCGGDGYADDDGDSESGSSVVWIMDGVEVGYATLLDADLLGGDVVTCQATPSDGTDEGATLSAQVVVGNTPPSIDEVTVTPDPAAATDTLTCAFSGYSDVDGDDEDGSTYVWTVGGVEVGEGETLDEGFGGGDEVTCTVTPSDGTDEGDPVSGAVTIDNTLPSILAVYISPDPAYAGDELTCSYSGYTDADGDAEDGTTIAWTVNGADAGVSDATLSADLVAGDVVKCSVTPDDDPSDELAGASLAATLVVTNSPPSIDAVEICLVDGSDTVCAADVAPDELVVSRAETLTCVYSGFSDPDVASGTPDTSGTSYSWLINGEVADSSQTLLASFESGDTIQCEVTPADGITAGETVTSDAVTVADSAPEVYDVALTPEDAYADDRLTCSYSFYDADGDADQSTITWYNAEGEIADETDANLYGAFSGGDEIYCSVTANDGDTEGNTEDSNSVLILNSAPSASNVEIEVDGTCDGTSDGTVGAGQVVSCCYDYADIDGDSESGSTFSWSINGSSQGVSTSTFTLPSGFSDDSVISCSVTPSDGATYGSTRTAYLYGANSAPVVDSIYVDYTGRADGDTPTAGLDMECVYSTSDADGDSVTVTVTWTVVNGDSTTTYSGDTLAGDDLVEGDVITCTGTPFDGLISGDAVTSDSVEIGNSPPSLTSAYITPTTASAGEVAFTCNATGYSDADGDANQSTFAWSLNSATPSGGDVVVAASGTGAASTITLDVVGGDVVGCVATPYDGTSSGAAVTAPNITVDASVPTVNSISLTPTTAYTDDTLTCTYSGTDVDGPSNTSSFTWLVNGSEVSAATESHNLSGASMSGTSTLSSSNFSRDNLVQCVVTPANSTSTGDDATASVTIQNSTPSVSGVTITSASGSDTVAYTGEELTCSFTYTDADAEDTLADSATAIDWTVGGVSVGSSDTISFGYYAGDTLTCTVTPSDGIATGTARSDSVTIVGYLDVSAGESNTCSADTTNTTRGAVSCSGSDTSNVISSAPSATSYTAISVGDTHACALTNAGAIDCWGSNSSGQSTDPSGSGYTAVAAGTDFSCAIDSGGDIVCWGKDTSGQVSGLPDTSYGDTADTGSVDGAYAGYTFTDIDAGLDAACAVADTTEVVCWGNSASGVVTNTPTDTGYVQVGVGDAHACALDDAGRVTCWGTSSTSAQVADAPTGPSYTDLDAGGDFACAVFTGGAVTCWGDDTAGQITGTPDVTDSTSIYYQLDFVRISVGVNHACGLITYDSYLCWGTTP
jgi:hypothetical protein